VGPYIDSQTILFAAIFHLARKRCIACNVNPIIDMLRAFASADFQQHHKRGDILCGNAYA
jgi:hypothetical protein